MKLSHLFTLSAIFLFGFTQELQAQYFGKNKPRYTNFDFQVVQSPHYEIYHYLKDPASLERAVQWTEAWHDLHSAILRDTFKQKNPLIFYSNHADFQQTNAISGNIGPSTGGVTEGFKNRVVQPIAISNQKTFQVLGHELVHAFQFNMLLRGSDSTSLQSLSNLPLWIVEGMAEYMSIGRIDAHTAMWMRNAVLNNDVPSLKKLSTSPNYFPYRYGQAFWSFLTGLYGDEIIKPLFMNTAKYGIEAGVALTLGIKLDDLSDMWVDAINDFYKPLMGDLKEDPEGRKFLSEENSGRLNISPSISPNGRYMVFLSERSIFTTDLFLADVRTGEIIRKVESKTKNGAIDHLDFMESSGTWSPDSKQFAFVVFGKGRNRLVINEAQSGKRIAEFPLEGVPAFNNPTWSPDGKTIVVNGLVEGQPDLFAVNVRTQRVTQLTNNIYSELQPFFAYDGDHLVFTTDELSMIQGRTHGAWKHNLAKLNLEDNAVEHLDIFPGANNMNPVYDEDENLYFLSDRDGFRNIYRYQEATGILEQMTNVLTGVSGITKFSPALTISKKGTSMLYTHYYGSDYNIYRARPESLNPIAVDPDDVTHAAALLPPGMSNEVDLVNPALYDLDNKEMVTASDIEEVNYQAKFKLDYLSGGGGVGVGTSTSFGTSTGLVGGVSGLFSDILGNNKIFGTLALNGEIQDFGGQVMWLNTKGKIGYGASLSHIPFRFGQSFFDGIDTLQFNNGGQVLAENWEIQVSRIFRDEARLFAQMPFSSTTRVEVGTGFSRYSSRSDIFDNFYDGFGRLIAQDRRRGPKLFDGFNLYNFNAAYVGDNSFFGLTAPMSGYRYRIGVDQFLGEFTYTALLIDGRKYFWFDKFNISIRGLHYARYGTDGNSQSLGYMYSIDPTLVRGYNNINISNINELYGLSVNQIQGSKIAVGNLEVRIPFTGPEQLALIKSKFLFADLNLFLDSGVTWFTNDQFGGDASNNIDPKVVSSTGISMRVNLFGALILEPYYAKPLVKGAPWNFGINFVPGW
ncbi:MAG: hypothetical protein KTR24_10995 [Saprospiraceae bacterium]|nr:hypothetical protein [Saprospiraceae bacterium]